MAKVRVEPSGNACGASVTGVDLSAALDAETIAAIRAAWLEHHVLSFPEQEMDDDALERFAIAMGGLYGEPFFGPLPSRTHLSAIKREADERVPLFAQTWHSDWSFEAQPPAGTCLLAIEVPPTGGDTLFANQHAAWDALPDDRKARLVDLIAVQSARRAFAPDGLYGQEQGRSMDIRISDKALAVQKHPLVIEHPETGRRAFFSTWGYIVGIEGMADEDAAEMLIDLRDWQVDDRFVHRQRWEQGMLVLWDNRSLLHCATGGYDGYRRELHRATIAGPVPGRN